MSTEDRPTWELTRNPVDETWGFICLEHGIHRAGLSERHAINVEAKHVREDHADPEAITLNISALADMVLTVVDHRQANTAWACWMALTGITDTEAAVEMAGRFAGQGSTAAVVPF